MAVKLHWFLPTSGDGRTLLGAMRVVLRHHPVAEDGPGDRPASLHYLRQVAQAAERAGFDAVLTPTGTWCDDAWLTTAALIGSTERLRFLVAFRPGLQSPTLAAQAAATFQRISGGRLALNLVAGADDAEQRRFGDFLSKDERYARAEEFMTVVEGAWSGEPFSFEGEHVTVDGAIVINPPPRPEVYLGGASAPALQLAARHADVFLTWGEPPAAVAEQNARVRALAEAAGRELRYGIRLHIIARAESADAWRAAERLLDGADQSIIDMVQSLITGVQSEGQRRQRELHGGNRESLEFYPNMWAGLGLLRPGAGVALVGSYEEVADRIEEFHELGVEEFIFSSYPHLEEIFHVSEGVMPELRRRGLLHPVNDVLLRDQPSLSPAG